MDDSSPEKPRPERDPGHGPPSSDAPVQPAKPAKKAVAKKAAAKKTQSRKKAPAKPGPPAEEAAPTKAPPLRGPAVTTPPKKTPPKKTPPKKTPPKKANPPTRATPVTAPAEPPPTPPTAVPLPTPAPIQPAPTTVPLPAVNAAAGEPDTAGPAAPRTREGWLADEAVERYGPGAQAWAARLRSRYPTVTPDGIARLAVRDHVRLARLFGAVGAVSLPLGPVLGTPAALALQGRLVAYIAAAYGIEARPGELIALVGRSLRRAVGGPARLIPGAAIAIDAKRLTSLGAKATRHYRSQVNRSENRS